MPRRSLALPLLVLSAFQLLAPAASAQPDPDAPPEKPPEKAPEKAPEKQPDPPPADEPSDEELLAEEMGPDPARPPPKGKGAIWGVLTDTKLKEPLIEAEVSVIGRKEKTLTDIDGRFRLELPPGTYTLRFYYELHQPARVQNIQVAAGQVTRIDQVLTPDEKSVDVIEVTAEVERATLEGQTLSRQRSAAVGDSVGRGEISKSADSNAAQAAQRVVGANIVDGRFVYVRGLGERYTNSLLNGAPLPSPEPDQAAVPLDLFPSLVLESITIAKTFTPDIPGDFAGGSVQIETRQIPTKPLFQVSLSGGFNTQSTFRNRLSHRGSSTDWLGFDSSTRKLPEGLPNYRLADGTNKPNPPPNPSLEEQFVLPPELQVWGRKINSYMSTTEAFTPPNHGLSVVAGSGFKLGKDQKLGVLASLNYSRSFDVIEDEIIREYAFDPSQPSGLARQIDYETERGIDKVRWGAFGSVVYEPGKHHRLRLLGFHSQLSDKKTSVFDGESVYVQQPVHAWKLEFVSRALNFGQLAGSHEFEELGKAKLDWNASYSVASRNEPDTRDVVYGSSVVTGIYSYTNGSESGRHFFASQSERAIGGGIDWTQPVADDPEGTKLKFGGLISLKDRKFDARRFALRSLDTATNDPLLSCGGDFNACADALFRNNNIGPILQLEEGTSGKDSYDAGLNVYAGYLMGDVALSKKLRAILGQRIEITRQDITPRDPINTGEAVEGADLKSTDLLPSVSLIYSATEKAKLRAAVTRTLARPQLREMAPFAYSDYFRGRQVAGYKDLTLTHITNADLRFEYFPTLREVLAFSVFYKHFEDPIERVVIAAGGGEGTTTFRNTPGANLIGVELEGRKHLEFLSDALEDFSIIANLTLARSRVEVEDSIEYQLTNLSRPMANQAPYVLNIALDYTSDAGTKARILYNVSGPRLHEVGTDRLDDAYEQPRHVVDVVVGQEFFKHLELKAVATNILNSKFLITQGKTATDDNIVRRYSEGTTIGLSASYTY